MIDRKMDLDMEMEREREGEFDTYIYIYINIKKCCSQLTLTIKEISAFFADTEC